MLSSTAEHLYWMARSMERAENTARMLDVTYRMSLLKRVLIEPHHEWRAMLSISGLHKDFEARYDIPNEQNVLYFMVLDINNPGSIYNSLYVARENARAIRGTITSEMWEALNATWLEMRKIHSNLIDPDGISRFFEWVKERSHLLRGIAYGTMLRDNSFSFIRLGTYLERADNTARILDVKYHILLPSLKDIGGAADYYQWSAVLRSVSAFESYRKIYRDLITPKRVAELLVLRPDVARSIITCVNEVNRLLHEINGPRSEELIQRWSQLHANLHTETIDHLFKLGLHEYITWFLEQIYELGNLINKTYFWPTDDVKSSLSQSQSQNI
jgi:uncharacterized alpha-E superfamily protein